MQIKAQHFDENYYLTCWPDVRRAVEQGVLPCGFAHWQAYGRSEGRAYRKVGEPTIYGERMPGHEKFSDNLGSWESWPSGEYRHRGIAVRSCLDPQVQNRLAEQVHRLRDGTIVEVGVYGGATLLDLAQRAQAQGNRLIGIDPWEKVVTARQGHHDESSKNYAHFAAQLRWNIAQAIAVLRYDHISLMHDFSVPAASQLSDASADFIIIDGDHSFAAVRDDLRAWWPKLKVGGTLWGDDFDHPGVQAAAEQFCQANELSLNVWHRQFTVHKAC